MNAFTTAAGCDSTITTTVIVHPVYDITNNHSVCTGDSVQLPDGSYTSVSGTFTHVLSTTQGCDSTVVSNVTVDSIFITNQSFTVCLGDSVLLPDGSYTDTTGSYSHLLSSASSCDSVVNTDVTVVPFYDIVNDFSICAVSYTHLTLPTTKQV